ncbi:hypothetical protein FB451DRAFT_1172066 [Mycena latifolia]|nr:hypothetical protein FB451DRAFT_1172066 [Mycena latifolia]
MQRRIGRQTLPSSASRIGAQAISKSIPGVIRMSSGVGGEVRIGIATKRWGYERVERKWGKILKSLQSKGIWTRSCERLLSSISNDDWNITPLHSNYVETAHAGRNAETAIGVGLLTAILQAQERDNKRAEEIAQVERDGVMHHRLNGAGECEKQIKSIQAEQQLDRHRTDLKVAVNELRADIEAEKAGRREWAIRRGEIDEELEGLRKGPLAGARIKGRRPTERPSGEGDPAQDPSVPAANRSTIEDDELNQAAVEPTSPDNFLDSHSAIPPVLKDARDIPMEYKANVVINDADMAALTNFFWTPISTS